MLHLRIPEICISTWNEKHPRTTPPKTKMRRLNDSPSRDKGAKGTNPSENTERTVKHDVKKKKKKRYQLPSRGLQHLGDRPVYRNTEEVEAPRILRVLGDETTSSRTAPEPKGTSRKKKQHSSNSDVRNNERTQTRTKPK